MIGDISKVIQDKLIALNEAIYRRPELGNKEYFAAENISKLLKMYGFDVKVGLNDMPTAFKAVYDTGKYGPTIAYLCEYDALPEIGHGCGHNMIATMGAGAAIVLKESGIESGKIVVLGTPAEETDGGKVYMVNDGVFDDVDVALILHPSDKSYCSGDSLAMDAYEFEYTGRTAHAASEPESGINALDSVLLLFNGINALRQHVKPDVRIHGIIKEGGLAANIVPDKGVAQFYIRAAHREYLDTVVEKVIKIAESAATMTGATLKYSNYEISYDNMVTNSVLSETFEKNLRLLGVEDIEPSSKSYGSVDMGNVSKVVPSIHPYIGIGKDIIGHTKGFAEQTITDVAEKAMLNGIKALAMTGNDILENEKLYDSIRHEFNNKKS